MAEDELVGNLATETILNWLDKKGDTTDLKRDEFQKALIMADSIFPKH